MGYIGGRNGQSTGLAGPDSAGNGNAGGSGSGYSTGDPTRRALILLLQIAREWLGPAAFIYAIIWLRFDLQPIHIYFLLALVIGPVLLEQGVIRTGDLAQAWRAMKGLPEPFTAEQHVALLGRVAELERAVAALQVH